MDLKNIQKKALEQYYAANGSYPSSDWLGNCSSYGSHPTLGPNGYVPNLAPKCTFVLPLDPRQRFLETVAPTPGAAALLVIFTHLTGRLQNNVLYKTVEVLKAIYTNYLSQFYDSHESSCIYTLYTPGAQTKGWH